jgi:hypothetical protein
MLETADLTAPTELLLDQARYFAFLPASRSAPRTMYKRRDVTIKHIIHDYVSQGREIETTRCHSSRHKHA